jgi:hypothetical protein
MNPQSTSKRPHLKDLLGVSLQFLDPDAEMRRFFGSKVVLASKAGESSQGALKKAQNVRSYLARPQATWWPSQGREGLSLRSYNERETSEKFTRQAWSPIQEKWWTVEYNKKYNTTTRQFMSAVMAGGESTNVFLNLALPNVHRPAGFVQSTWDFSMARRHTPPDRGSLSAQGG